MLWGRMNGLDLRLIWAGGLNLRLAGSCGLDLRVGLTRAHQGLIDWHGAGLDSAISSEGPRRCDDGGTASVCCIELAMVLGGIALVLELGGHGCGAGAAHGCQFGGLRTDSDAATAAVVGDAVVVVVDDDGAVVDVGDVVDVHAVDGGVVVEAVSVPVAAVIAVAGVPEAVIDASVVADVRSPEATMEAVAVTEEEPVAGGPECSSVRGGDPGSGDPVVAGGGVAPVAGGPDVVGGRSGWLVVGRKRRWRLVGFECGLAGVYLIFVAWIVVVIGWVLVGLRLWRSSGLGVLFGALLALVLGALAEYACGLGLSWSGGWLLGLIGVDWGEVGVCRIGAGLSRCNGSAGRLAATDESDGGHNRCEPDSQT